MQPVLILRNFRPIQKILVAYRGSQCDQGALEFIAPLFAKKKPEITILHVQETERGESEEFAESCLLTGEETLREHGYTPVKKMAKGDFVDEILKAVAVERYDLLVLGAYGHKRPKYLKVLSDEALNLVRLTTRPVLVYRDEKEGLRDSRGRVLAPIIVVAKNFSVALFYRRGGVKPPLRARHAVPPSKLKTQNSKPKP